MRMKMDRYAVTVVGLCLLTFVLVACQREDDAPEKSAPATKSGRQLLDLPRQGAYLGAYVDFGETEDGVTREALENFGQMVGKMQAVIAFSSYWGKQGFPREQLDIVRAYGAVPLIYWSPWDHPFREENKPDRFNLRNIIAGQWDDYIDMWARQAIQYGGPLLVSWGLEMNGTWFPWSGSFYGGGTVIPGSSPPLYEGPELYKQAYRHVVDRVRATGAANIKWVFHVNNTSEPNEPWNRMAQYWPGPEYVDWLGLSAYGKQYAGPSWTPFEIVLPAPYREICALDPAKPFILAEWGVGEFPREGDKGRWIAEALQRMENEFPRLKAMVFWHERWQNSDLSYSNLRVNSSQEALDAYRAGVSRPFWLDRPVFTEKP